MPREWRRALREGTPINLMLIDVDHFKQYNDTAGHQAGDQVLARVAAVLREHSRRAGDFCFRIGGEEFALLTRTLNHDDAKPRAEALRAACEGLAIPHPGRPSGSVVTVSIGALWVQPVALGSDRATIPDDWNALYRRADALLYAAKEQGRNRVVADLWRPTAACDP